MRKNIIPNLESPDLQVYISKHMGRIKNKFIVDLTDIYEWFRPIIEKECPELNINDIFTIFKISVELHYMTYVINGGYLDEIVIDLFNVEMNKLDIKIPVDDSELLAERLSNEFYNLFVYCVSYTPLDIVAKDSIPLRWEITSNRIKLIIAEVLDIRKDIDEGLICYT